jgi:hypothetical protein
MTNPSYPHLIGIDEANRLRKLALQRAQVLRREAIADAWQLPDAAVRAALARFRRGAQRLTGRHSSPPESVPTAAKTLEITTTLKEPDPCPPCN